MNTLDYDYYIFDCDGVVLDSNRIKTEAFREVLSTYDKRIVDEFITYHKAHGGVSRYEKFKYFFNEILKSPSQENVNLALEEYGKICKRDLIYCSMTFGARDYLDRLKKLNKPVFINSGGDQAELKSIFSTRNENKLFTKIYGSPKTKIENIQLMYDEYGVSGKGIFFGDAKSDFLASKEYEIDFVFIKDYSEWKDGSSFCSRKNIKQVNNFRNLLEDISLKI